MPPSSSNQPLSTLPTYISVSTSRLKSLYADFSLQKHSNPTSYASNVEWWRRTLETVVSSGWLPQHQGDTAAPDRLILHANGPVLAEAFRYEGVGKPLALPTVIAELAASKAYFSLSDFMNASQSIYDPGWLPYRIASFVVGKPLWWALQQLNVVGDDAAGGHASDRERWKKAKGDYVVVNLLEQAAENVMRRQRSKAGGSLADSLYTAESFRREFESHALEGVVLSASDMRVVAKHLERDKKALIVQKGVIKFIDEEVETPVPEVTAVDVGILELKTAVEKLQIQVDSIQGKIDERARQISGALQQKRKELALTHLRARKQLEDLFGKRLKSLETLQSTLLRVEASAGDVEIMKFYESSTVTLRTILAHPSLQREKIDETMDAMASANADAKDIDDAVRMGADMAQADAGLDEADLEDELQALIKEDEREKADRARAEAKRWDEETRRAQEEQLNAGELRVPSRAPGEISRDEAVTLLS
ncbi:hypothetical protein B0H21DRAFT_7245 [Amylocystis lapponica]|nr:hypothetical protein B0H21DRAFT_7245 [Amylocystis lapponica]